MDELAMLLEGMPPEQVQQLLGLGAIDEEQALLQQQMALAEQLRQGGGGSYSTPLGAALGGLGDVVGGTAGAFQQKGIGGEMQANVGRRVEGRDAYAQAMIDALRRQRADAMGGLTSRGGGVIAPVMGGG